MTSDDDPELRRVPDTYSKTDTLERLLMVAGRKGDVLLTHNSKKGRWWCSIYQTPRDEFGGSRFIGQNARPGDRPHKAVFDALEDFTAKEKEQA